MLTRIVTDFFTWLRPSSFQRKIILWLVLLNMMVWLLAAYSIREDKLEHESRARTSVQNISQLLAHDLNTVFSRSDLMLRNVAYEAEKQLRQGGIRQAEMNEYLHIQHAFLPEVLSIRIVDALGDIRYGEGLPSGKPVNIADREHFQVLKQRADAGTVIKQPVKARINHEWVIPVARRINGPDGAFAGIASINLPIADFVQKFSHLDLGKGSLVTLRSDENISFARYPDLAEGSYIGQKAISEQLQNLLKGNPQEVSYVALSPIDGIERLFSYRKLANYPLYVVAGYDIGESLGEWYHDTMQTLMMAGLISVISLLFGRIMLNSWRKQLQAHAALHETEQRWSFALESGNFAVWDWDLTSNKVVLSKLGKELFGFEDHEIGNDMKEWLARCHPDDIDRVDARIKDHFRKRADFFAAEYRVLSKDNNWKWIYSRGLVVNRAADGKPLRMIGFHADISLRKKLEEDMLLATSAYNMANEAMVVTDENNQIISINPAFTRITGYALEEVKGSNPGMLSAKQQGKEFYLKMWDELIDKGSWAGELLNRRKNGELFHEWLSIKRVLDENGKLTHHVAVFSDITKRKEAEERMRHLALHDALTGLPNRLLLHERMKQTILRSRREKNHFALLYFDLDKFKPVNDKHGHEVGDWLLKQVAERVLQNVRESDTVVRLGGDEFVVLLSKIGHSEDALVVAEKILQALIRQFEFAELKLEISSSIGVAIYPQHGTEDKEIMRNADSAMYYAKKNGRSRVVMYHPGMELDA